MQENTEEIIMNAAPEVLTRKDFKEKFAQHINYLVSNDFASLIQLLYRTDISEQKLKETLQVYQNENAGDIIAEMIIERQLQKIKTRQAFSSSSQNFSDDEKW